MRKVLDLGFHTKFETTLKILEMLGTLRESGSVTASVTALSGALIECAHPVAFILALAKGEDLAHASLKQH